MITSRVAGQHVVFSHHWSYTATDSTSSLAFKKYNFHYVCSMDSKMLTAVSSWGVCLALCLAASRTVGQWCALAPFPVSIRQPMPAPARRADGQAVSSLISYGDIFLFVAHKLQEQGVYETDIWHWLVKIPPNQSLWWHQGETHKLCFIPSIWENNWDRNTEFFGVRHTLENYLIFLHLIFSSSNWRKQSFPVMLLKLPWG